MPTTYTNIAKPSGTSYTRTNPIGRETYDDPTVTYDSSSVFYDGINQLLYTKIAKPLGGAVINAGMATGLLIPLTYSISQYARDAWTKIAKP